MKYVFFSFAVLVIVICCGLPTLLEAMPGPFPIFAECSDISLQNTCMADCRCAWCYNTSMCFDEIHHPDTNCTASVTAHWTKSCRKAAGPDFKNVCFFVMVLFFCYCAIILLCGQPLAYRDRVIS